MSRSGRKGLVVALGVFVATSIFGGGLLYWPAPTLLAAAGWGILLAVVLWRSRVEVVIAKRAAFPQLNPYPVIEADQSGELRYINPAAERLFPDLRQSGRAHPWLADWVTVVRSFREGGATTAEREVAIGDRCYQQAMYYVAETGCVRVYGVDVTRRKLSEESLKANRDQLEAHVRQRTAELNATVEALAAERRRFHEVLDALPVYVVLLSPDYHVPFANRVFVDMFGESPGKRCFEHLFGRSEPCEICETYKVLKTGVPCQWEWTGPNGHDYSVFDFPFSDTDGSPLILEMGIDVTQRKQAETELENYRRRLEELVQERTAQLEAANVHLRTEIEERQRAEIALRQSEQRVRLKLESILSPDGDIGKLDLADVIDSPAIQSLMDDFYELARIPMAVIDLEGRVMVGVGWQDICTRFHRVHAETRQHCIESDTQLSAGIPAGECRMYKCKNHMWDIATPIVIGGQHVGNVFAGQFFFEGEAPDLDLFRSQARQYGFDEEKYLAALDAVPRLSRETIDAAMAFFRKLANIISQLSFSNIKLARSLAEGETLTKSLRKSQETLRQLNRTLRAHSRSDQALLRATDEKAYLDEVCGIIVEDCGHAMVWVGMAENDAAKSVRPVAHAGFEQGYLDTLDITWNDTERGRGPTGTAIRSGQPSICRDMLSDPAFAPWRAEALKRGYASSITLPLLDGERAFGAVMIYSKEPDQFGDEEVDLLSKLADDFAYGIQSLRLRAAHAVAEEELAAIYENAPLIMLLVDSQRRVRKANKYAEQFAGEPLTDLQRRRGGEALHCINALEAPNGCGSGPHCGECVVRKTIQETLETGTSRTQVEASLPLLIEGKAQQVTILLSTTRISVRGEALVLLTIQDITQRKQAEESLQWTAEELARSNEDLGQFAYVASHDLQEPLRMVSGFLQLLQKKYAGHLDADADQFIEYAVDGAKRMQTLINDLLAYSRVGTRGRGLATIDARTALDRALENLRAGIDDARAEITHGELPTVNADASQLAQLFQNLIGNALKFRAAAAPKIHVDARLTDDGRWLFSVRDNGIGIAPEFRDRIFLIFQRLHTRQQYPGTGIGLAICKKIVDRHGGQIWVESDAGQGATFYFTLAGDA